MRLLLPDWDAARALDGLPAGVEPVLTSGIGPLPAEVADVEFAVVEPPPGGDPARLLEALPRVRVVQTVSAGVDWMPAHAQRGITLCDAAGVHDVPVAESDGGGDPRDGQAPARPRRRAARGRVAQARR